MKIFKPKFIIIYLFVFLTLVFFLWVFGFLQANDFSVETKTLPSKVNNILVVFPHADDEALTSGGLLSQLSHEEKEVTWVLLTRGEKGNEGSNYDENLKAIRTKEAENVSKIYGIKKLIQRDYKDSGVEEEKDRLKEDLKNIIKEVSPELVITYDEAGLYGHPDHIVVSEVVTEILQSDFTNIKLWYASFPKKLLESVPLPEQMAKDPNYKDKRAYPTAKIWVGLSGIINKIKAIYTYKSQEGSYKKIFPYKFIPLWFYISLTPFEYYHEVL